MLVVDDNLINRKVAMGFLKNYGFELTEAGSGAEAIELVRKNRYNMIFMDHMMPEMDGIEATRIIREECGANGRTPVMVALTANAMEGMRDTFLKCGFQDFISKPLDRKQLKEVLTRWIPSSFRHPKRAAKKKQVVQIKFEDINIKGIDIGAAMRYHTGEVADYLELLQLYCMDGRRKCELLRKLLGEHDYANYEIEVHGLKSASANIGAMELSGHAKEHEEAASRGDEEFIVRHADDLLNCYETQLDEIEGFLKRREQEQEDGYNDDVVCIDKQVIIRETREALNLLENFHPKDSIRILEGILHYQLDFELKEKLQEIEQQLKMYEDDKAEELLNQLIEWLEREE